VVIAPLRFGAGVKGKVIEAMAKAVPVATTSVGAQGIDGADGRLFLGDDPQALANAVFEALNNRAEAQRRCKAALDFIASDYSEAMIRNLFNRIAVR
jgi:glycosyltransferase involved in cell wall biosynthesis